MKLNISYAMATNVSVHTERKISSTPHQLTAHIEFYNRAFTILPIALHLLKYRPQPFKEPAPSMLKTDKALLPWDKNTRRELQEAFKGMPLLNMCDAILMVPTMTRQSKEELESEHFLVRVYFNMWLMMARLNRWIDTFSITSSA